MDTGAPQQPPLADSQVLIRRWKNVAPFFEVADLRSEDTCVRPFSPLSGSHTASLQEADAGLAEVGGPRVGGRHAAGPQSQLANVITPFFANA